MAKVTSSFFLATAFVVLLLALATGGLARVEETASRRAHAAYAVDDRALVAAATRPGDWLSYGRTYKEQRFSPLEEINDETINQLGLAMVFETGTRRGLEATPLVVDGVLYATTTWSRVAAYDVASGEPLWSYDPEVPKSYAQRACCDVVNRGAAIYKGRVIVGTLDGRLIALDAETGTPIWETLTVDQERPYTITGAPRVVKGRVIIGNGGAEYGVRGYVSAYDAETGELVWRFYTVPGNPADGFENEAMKMAALTWTGEWWIVGGGGTAWDSFVFDPELDLLYVGVGNGSPWNRDIRSPGGGDNLFLSSIVALRPDTGEYVWHYQTTPGETWDYTATQPMVLAELTIDGRERKVLMQAPKNGFFYVLDRETGELISAENYVPVTWATHVDLATGRPVETPGARYREGPAPIHPGPLGGHNWHPMAYSPETQLVYIPAMEMAALYRPTPGFTPRAGQWNTGTIPAPPDFTPESLIDKVPGVTREFKEQLPTGHLLAWDPVEQKEVWRAEYEMPWSGGVLATAGNLVFQGTPWGILAAYKADTGEKLWESYTGSGVIAAPITFAIGGKQHIAVLSGWGGAYGMAGSRTERKAVRNVGRVLVYALGASLDGPEPELPKETRLERIEHDSSEDAIASGESLFSQHCQRCHGYGAVSGNVVTDVRASSERVFDNYDAILLEGRRVERGMPSFDGVLSPEDVAALKAYVLHRRDEWIERRASPP